jgi:hypothetical protein
MYTPGGNIKVCNALMGLDNGLTDASEKFVESLKSIGADHPELSDTAVRDFLGDAIFEIIQDFSAMMLDDDDGK